MEATSRTEAKEAEEENEGEETESSRHSEEAREISIRKSRGKQRNTGLGDRVPTTTSPERC